MPAHMAQRSMLARLTAYGLILLSLQANKHKQTNFHASILQVTIVTSFHITTSTTLLVCTLIYRIYHPT